jgi:hypothetical protein
MNSGLLKYISLLSLLVFLSPPVIEGLHDFHFSKIERCTEKTEKHLHKQSHHCLICGVNTWLSHYTAMTAFTSNDPVIINDFVLADSGIAKFSNPSGFQLRAPPFLLV